MVKDRFSPLNIKTMILLAAAAGLEYSLKSNWRIDIDNSTECVDAAVAT